MRVLKDGQDKRFNEARDNPSKFFVFWSLQVIIKLLVKGTANLVLYMFCPGSVGLAYAAAHPHPKHGEA